MTLDFWPFTSIWDFYLVSLNVEVWSIILYLKIKDYRRAKKRKHKINEFYKFRKPL